NWFCRELRAAILRYEPSINMLKVSVKDAYHQTLALSLEAMLQSIHSRPQVFFPCLNVPQYGFQPLQ
ncbi:hypothetical protein MJN76_29480, partial [Salmonella enterica subsp. enterica serovar Anatum]|nr:hypothetical protein [Salmonella enterica subsp. enterica serovar Anatum]